MSVICGVDNPKSIPRKQEAKKETKTAAKTTTAKKETK